MRAFLAIIAGACALAQSGIERAPTGQILDARGRLWPVYGLPGSFLLTKPVAMGILSMACSRQLCLKKSEFNLTANGIAIAAPRGPALIGLDGADAWVYFTRTRQLGRWHDGALTPAGLDVDGQVLALGPGPTLAVRRPSGVWIVRADGTILDSLPSETTLVQLTASATVYAEADSLVLRRQATEQRFPAPGVTLLLQMNDGLIEARGGSILYALRIDPGKEQLFQVPQPSAWMRP